MVVQIVGKKDAVQVVLFILNFPRLKTDQFHGDSVTLDVLETDDDHLTSINRSPLVRKAESPFFTGFLVFRHL